MHVNTGQDVAVKVLRSQPNWSVQTAAAQARTMRSGKQAVNRLTRQERETLCLMPKAYQFLNGCVDA